MPSQIDRLLTDLAQADGPHLSIYQGTHRHHPENQQDPIRYRNLVKEAEASLRSKFPQCETDQFLAPFRALADQGDFWNHTLNGLAVFGGGGGFRAIRMPKSVSDLVVVADSFHLKPLRRFLQTVDRYQVLSLTRKRVRFFEGNRHALDEVDLPAEIPATMEDALGEELTEPHQTVASYGGAGSTPMRHGHGDKKEEVDGDTQRFFRIVDRAVTKHFSDPSGLPLLLAALPEHQPVFREVSKNGALVNERVAKDPTSLSVSRLRDEAWEAMKPRFDQRIEELVDGFQAAQARGEGTAEIDEIGVAAVAGRVKTLLIEADREIPGRVDAETGAIEFADLADPDVDDILDDLGELVDSRGGRVHVIPADAMPVDSGLAATFRY